MRCAIVKAVVDAGYNPATADAIVTVVIDALMEPSDKMVGVASGLCDFCFVPGVIETIEDYKKEIRMIFRTMLDEAKK